MEVSRRICMVIIMVMCFYGSLVSTQSTVTRDWANKQADVYFLLDSSSSVWIVDYREKLLTFIRDLISDMDIGPTRTRVGVGVYSVNYHNYIPIDNTRTKQELIEAVKDTPYLKGNTFISRAIHGVRTVGLSPDKTRKGVPLITVLITDGKSRYRQLSLANSTLAKQEGISIFTIGVGWDVNKDELWSIASDPKETYVSVVNSFFELAGLKRDLSRKMASIEYLQKDQRGSCGGDKEADVVFVYDEAALGQKESLKIKTFIADIVKDLSVNSGKVRVGVVSKTCHEGIDINLDRYQNIADFKNGIINNGKGPGLSDLFKRASLQSFLETNGGRNNAQRRIVLFLTEELSERSPILFMAFKAKQDPNVEIYAIQFGNKYNKAVLERLVKSKEQVVYYDSTEFLVNEGSQQLFTSIFCTGL